MSDRSSPSGEERPPGAIGDPAPIIVTALLGQADFGWLDSLRRAHFPPDRNLLAAHLTLFHHLPPSVAPELARRLADATAAPRPEARAAGWISLGRGTALRIESAGLAIIRGDLADAFAGLLTPQDAAGWRPHVTIQNKVSAADAKALRSSLEAGFTPRPMMIAGLASWRYRGGPWEKLRTFPFRG